MSDRKHVALKPCPFCGETRISFNQPSKDFKGSINCPACLATMPREVNDDDELIACWNGRAALQQPEQGWRDIESHDMNKDDCLIWDGYDVTVAYCTGYKGRFCARADGSIVRDIDGRSVLITATHWQPLPETPPPTTAKE